MYVSSGSACTEHNSQTPMDPRAIAAQYNRVARMVSYGSSVATWP